MRIVIFCHSLVSDWNHPNAHFLRGVVAELLDRGHAVRTYEPRDGWSRRKLVEDSGEAALEEVYERFPWMASVVTEYELEALDVDEALDGAQLVLVHEWSEPSLVARIGARRAAGGAFRLLFHDTHHRAATAPEDMGRYDLSEYDGVLAFGEAIRAIHLDRGWAQRAWTWHAAADTRVFRPLPGIESEADLIWIGNWGDDERGQELREFMLRPARRLRLRGTVHGVGYPWRGRVAVRLAGLRYRGRLANHEAPARFARHRVTVHVPRRPYVQALRGIPTIRPFEALACGIPLVSAPWDDADGLFRPGEDLLFARDGDQMCHQLDAVLHDSQLATALRDNGLETIAKRHTCAHRVDELLEIARELGVGAESPA